MEQWLYDSLLSLSLGNNVQFEEIRGFKLWHVLASWLQEHGIKYNIKVIGSGMLVDYSFTIDRRCAGRLGRILDKVEVV